MRLIKEHQRRTKKNRKTHKMKRIREENVERRKTTIAIETK